MSKTGIKAFILNRNVLVENHLHNKGMTISNYESGKARLNYIRYYHLNSDAVLICDGCGNHFKFCDLEVHHILSRALYPEYTYDTLNMLLYCEKCHNIVHGKCKGESKKIHKCYTCKKNLDHKKTHISINRNIYCEGCAIEKLMEIENE